MRSVRIVVVLMLLLTWRAFVPVSMALDPLRGHERNVRGAMRRLRNRDPACRVGSH